MAPHHQQAGCTGKDALTHEQAKAILARPGFRGIAYRCKCCDSWHISHPNRMPMKARRFQ